MPFTANVSLKNCLKKKNVLFKKIQNTTWCFIKLSKQIRPQCNTPTQTDQLLVICPSPGDTSQPLIMKKTHRTNRAIYNLYRKF